MQSSPPQRAWDPPSPATTRYSVDLAALDLDSRSGASSPLPGQEIDRILSEDIDGPSDFTQNMEQWMRAGSMKKSNMVKGRLGSVKEGREDDHGDDPRQDEKTASKQTTSNNRPKDSAVRDSLSRDFAEKNGAGSDGEGEINSQRARMNAAKTLLQPTVEDYHSELNLARVPSAQLESASGSAKNTAPTEKGSREISGHATDDIISPKRSPVLSQQGVDAVQPETSLQQQMARLDTRCQQLEKLNHVITERLDEERRSREADNASHDARLAEAARREKHLVEMKDQSQLHREGSRREVKEVQKGAQQRDVQHASHLQKLDQLQKDHAAEIQTLRKQLENERTEHEQEIHALEQEVALERSGRADFEETARTTREELDERRREVEKMRSELQQGEELREQIKEQLRAAKMDYEKLRGTSAPIQEAEQKTAIGNLQQELKAAKAALRREQEAHERARSAAPTTDVSEELESLRVQLNITTIERDELQDRLTAETEAREEACTRIARMKEVNKLVDVRISDSIKKREARWREKMAAMEKERRVMAKTLLRLWGKMEGGKEDEYGRQEYRFKFRGAKAEQKGVEEREEAAGFEEPQQRKERKGHCVRFDL